MGFDSVFVRALSAGSLAGGAPRALVSDTRAKPSIKDGVLRKRTRVGNFLSCLSMVKIAWVWIATIPAIWEALALLSGLNRGPQLTKPCIPPLASLASILSVSSGSDLRLLPWRRMASERCALQLLRPPAQDAKCWLPRQLHARRALLPHRLRSVKTMQVRSQPLPLHSPHSITCPELDPFHIHPT